MNLRQVAALAALGLGGCESCEWSLGAILVEVRAEPAGAKGEVTVCPEGAPCQSALLPADGSPAVFAIDWITRLNCFVPWVEVEVDAPGCAPWAATVGGPDADQGTDTVIEVVAPLSCP